VNTAREVRIERLERATMPAPEGDDVAARERFAAGLDGIRARLLAPGAPLPPRGEMSLAERLALVGPDDAAEVRALMHAHFVELHAPPAGEVG